MSTSTPTNLNDGGSDAIPASWPGAFGAYKYSKMVILKNVWQILGLYAVAYAVFIALRLLHNKDDAAGNALQLVGELISIAFVTAGMLTMLKGLHGKTITFMDAIKASLPFYLNMVVMYVLLAIIGVISIILLVIPYFIIVPRLVLAPYFMLDQKLDPIEALKASWHATQGNVGKVWGIIGATIAMCLLAITIIGIPFAVYFLFMYAASQVVLYGYLTRDSKAAVDA